MQLKFQFLLLLGLTVNTHAQNKILRTLNIGDPAPPLQVRDWLKGIEIEGFKKDQIYVIEFWATWCGPCIDAIPHLSALARQYKDKVTFLGINVYEKRYARKQKVKDFVDSMGYRMDYQVATADSNFMEVSWLDASGETGIPQTFVVNAEGRLAWMGHPKDLDDVLHKMVNNTWNINDALADRNESHRLDDLDRSVVGTLNSYVPDLYPGDLGSPHSTLLFINDIVTKEPKVKYAPTIAHFTFSALLKTDQNKAYEYGKAMLSTHTYFPPNYNTIPEALKHYSDKMNISAKLYKLGAESYQEKINKRGKHIDLPNNYRDMADMYWRAGNKVKARKVQRKAIKALKREKYISKTKMIILKSQLKEYKKM